MKLTVDSGEFRKALAVRTLIPNRTSLPILGHILLTAREGKLSVSATDATSYAEMQLDCNIEEEGSLAVPATPLANFVSSVPMGTLSISTDARGESVSLKRGTFQAKIKCLDAADFPTRPVLDESATRATITGEALTRLIEQSIFTAPTKAQMAYSGVYITIADEKLTLTSTDGFRISHATQLVPTNSAEPVSLIIPPGALSVVKSILNEFDDDDAGVEIPSVYIDQAFARFAVSVPGTNKGGFFVTTALAGNYPDMSNTLNKSYTHTLHLTAADLLQAISAIQSVLPADNQSTYLHFKPNHKLVISSGEKTLGIAKTEISAGWEGEVPTNEPILVDATYLVAGLRATQSPEVLFQFNTVREPICIQPATNPDGYKHLIMPMHTNNPPSEESVE